MASQTELNQARAALHDLVLGKRAVKIQKDGRTVEYQQVNIDELRVYIQQLESDLGVGTTRRGPAGVF
jgi:hypothetical protein